MRCEISAAQADRSTIEPRPEKEPIAIIDIGCRYPGRVKDPETFWQLLANSIDAITDIPAACLRRRFRFCSDRTKTGNFKMKTTGQFFKSGAQRRSAA